MEEVVRGRGQELTVRREYEGANPRRMIQGPSFLARGNIPQLKLLAWHCRPESQHFAVGRQTEMGRSRGYFRGNAPALPSLGRVIQIQGFAIVYSHRLAVETQHGILKIEERMFRQPANALFPNEPARGQFPETYPAVRAGGDQSLVIG